MSTPKSNFNTAMRIAYDDGIAIPYIGRFWLFLIPNILSLICCLFVLFHFVFDSTLRQGQHNHVIIVVLIICGIWELTLTPWTMHVFLFEVAWIQTPTFCIIWKTLDSVLYTTIAKLIAWTSIERHILIFHNHWLRTKMRRYLIHYLPLASIVIYGITLYGIITPMSDCGRSFYYFIPRCAYYSCVYNSVAFTLYEFVLGAVLCSTLIGFGSVFLILRVVYQKRRLQQQTQWRKHRKMTLQLLSVTSLFFVLYLPPVALSVARKLGMPSYIGATYSTYTAFFTEYIVFLFPFVCLSTIPHLRTRIKNILRCHWQRQMRAVAPETWATKSRTNHRTKKQTTTAV